MLAALLGMLVRRNFVNVERGEIGKALAIFSDDCRFTFPGSHSFAAVDFNKSQLREWLVRFAALHPRFEVGDVSRVCTRTLGQDQITSGLSGHAGGRGVGPTCRHTACADPRRRIATALGLQTATRILPMRHAQPDPQSR